MAENSSTMNHPLYAAVNRVVNEPALEEIVAGIAELPIFEWVAAYVVTDDGRIAVQHLPPSSKFKKGRVQSFGGNDNRRNLFFMMNKLRLELMDESSLAMDAGFK